MTIDFDELIDNHLARKSRPKKIGRYYPSGIGDCIRKTWFSYKIHKSPGPDLMKIFHTENMFHDFITEVIQSKKNQHIELIKSEMPIRFKRKDFLISGRIDNLVLLKVDDREVLVEVKSAKNLPNKPHLGNIMQLQFYMYATRVWDGLLVYVRKDDLKTVSFPIRCRKETAHKILKRFDIIHNHLTADTMPEPEAKLDKRKSWACDFCDYKEECDQN